MGEEGPYRMPALAGRGRRDQPRPRDEGQVRGVRARLSVCGSLVQEALPISRHAAGRAGGGLAERVMVGRHQLGALRVLVLVVVVEPVLAWLEGADDRVLRRL